MWSSNKCNIVWLYLLKCLLHHHSYVWTTKPDTTFIHIHDTHRSITVNILVAGTLLYQLVYSAPLHFLKYIYLHMQHSITSDREGETDRQREEASWQFTVGMIFVWKWPHHRICMVRSFSKGVAVLWPMPSLCDKARDSVLCTFSTRTSATAAGFARSSKLSSSRPGQAVQSVRESGMDRPPHHESHLAGSLSSSQPGGPPCWVISLAFGLIGSGLSCSVSIVLIVLHCPRVQFRKKWSSIWRVKTSSCQKRYGSLFDWSLRDL